jgi:hypothetical protein
MTNFCELAKKNGLQMEAVFLVETGITTRQRAT